MRQFRKETMKKRTVRSEEDLHISFNEQDTSFKAAKRQKKKVRLSWATISNTFYQLNRFKSAIKEPPSGVSSIVPAVRPKSYHSRFDQSSFETFLL